MLSLRELCINEIVSKKINVDNELPLTLFNSEIIKFISEQKHKYIMYLIKFIPVRIINETNIVASAAVGSIIDTIFKNERLTHKIENLSSITVKLPQENISTPGVYYYIFQRLAWEGIIIHEVISTTNEFTIIVSDEQIDIAFKVIKDFQQ
jgi:hypothetical protein